MESEKELNAFLSSPKYIQESGWIKPLLRQFQTHRDKTVVLIILQCPKEEMYLNVEEPECFTSDCISAIIQCMYLQPGVSLDLC